MTRRTRNVASSIRRFNLEFMNQVILIIIGAVVFFFFIGLSVDNTNERIAEHNARYEEKAELEHQRALELKSLEYNHD